MGLVFPPIRSGSIGITLDGGGAAVTTGSKGYVVVPYACTVLGWTIVADVSGSIVIDVKRSTLAGFPTTASIAGSELPTLNTAQSAQDAALTTWTTGIANGDILEFVVNSASAVTRVHLNLSVVKSQ